MTMRYSIGGDDLMWLLRVAGANGSPHTLKEILADVVPIVEPVDGASNSDGISEELWPGNTAYVPPAKPE